jgi:transcriptional regulator with XRE-family HTH domain
MFRLENKKNKEDEYMRERIVKLRKVLGLTQQQFADEIGIKRGTVANYEVGRNEPTEAVKRVVCETFGVNREWLETGEGEIFVKKGRDAIVRKMAYKLIVDEEDSFRLKLISVISELSKEQLQVLAYIAEKIIEQ